MDTLKSLKIKEWRLIMMKKRNVMILFSATVALTLAACGSKEQSSSTSSTSGTTKYASEVTHDGTPIKGGTLKYAIVSSSPFSGIFADELSAKAKNCLKIRWSLALAVRTLQLSSVRLK